MERHSATTPSVADAPAGAPRYWAYDRYALPLPARHRYPRGRFARVREAIVAEGLVPAERIHEAEPADWALLESVHTADYLRAVREGTLSARAVREIGLPFSPELVQRARAAVGATCAAARRALTDGAAGVLGGGTHHAFADHGAGYCLFSDIAVAIHQLRREAGVQRVAIVDLDVHQGNGNAELFAEDRDVFTLSVHGARNWPYRKSRSDLDVELPDGTGDTAYLAALEPPLADALERFVPSWCATWPARTPCTATAWGAWP